MRSKVSLVDKIWKVNEADAAQTVERLVTQKNITRNKKFVFYHTGFSGSGKTTAASQLFANFNSTYCAFPDLKESVVDNQRVRNTFDVFLFIPFLNNDEKCFTRADGKNKFSVQASVYENRRRSIEQKLQTGELTNDERERLIREALFLELPIDSYRFGGLYMYFCLEHLLKNGNTKAEFDLNQLIRVGGLCRGKQPCELIRELFEEEGLGTKRLLVNVDEHRHISDDPIERRGAMTALAESSENVTVLSTFISDIGEDTIVAQGASKVCRFGVPIPQVSHPWIILNDFEEEMKEIKDLVDKKRDEAENPKKFMKEFILAFKRCLVATSVLARLEFEKNGFLDDPDLTSLHMNFLKNVSNFLSREKWNFDKMIDEVHSQLDPDSSDPKKRSAMTVPVEEFLFGHELTEIKSEHPSVNYCLQAGYFEANRTHSFHDLSKILTTLPQGLNSQQEEMYIQGVNVFNNALQINTTRKDSIKDTALFEAAYAFTLSFSKGFASEMKCSKFKGIVQLNEETDIQDEKNEFIYERFKELEENVMYIPFRKNNGGYDNFFIDKGTIFFIEVKSGEKGDLSGYQRKVFPKKVHELMKKYSRLSEARLILLTPFRKLKNISSKEQESGEDSGEEKETKKGDNKLPVWELFLHETSIKWLGSFHQIHHQVNSRELVEAKFLGTSGQEPKA